MLYNASASPRTVLHLDYVAPGTTGRKLGRQLAGTTVAERAVLAAEAIDQEFYLVEPTLGQIACLFEISRSSLYTARALWPEERSASRRACVR